MPLQLTDQGETLSVETGRTMGQISSVHVLMRDVLTPDLPAALRVRLEATHNHPPQRHNLFVLSNIDDTRERVLTAGIRNVSAS